jgi:hypothetical protein
MRSGSGRGKDQIPERKPAMRKSIAQSRIIVFLLTITALLVAVFPVAAQGTPVRVYFVGPETGSIHQALTLTDDITFVTDPEEADVFVINGRTDNSQAIAAAVQAGAGLLLFLSPDNDPEEVSILLGTPVTLQVQSEPLSLTTPDEAQDITATGIVWNSAPQVRERMTVQGAALTPIVISFEDGSLVLGSTSSAAGQVFLFTAFLDESSNPQFQAWPYYNYLIYQLTGRAAGRIPLTFGDYPASPVPHSQARTVIFFMLGVLVVTITTIFISVRRYSLAHPEALDSLVADKDEFVNRQMNTDWEQLGFHRPLSGFLLAFVFQLILAVPLTIYSTVILPVYILPSAQALGIWGRVTQIFSLIWMLFDVGTSTAFVKFFSQYRVHEPRKAIKYIQFYVWWQALSGAFQVAWVTALASGLLPHTSPQCIERLAAIRLRPDPRPGRNDVLPDVHTVSHCAGHGGLGQEPSGVRFVHGWLTRPSHGRLSDRTPFLPPGLEVVQAAGLQHAPHLHGAF